MLLIKNAKNPTELDDFSASLTSELHALKFFEFRVTQHISDHGVASFFTKNWSN